MKTLRVFFCLCWCLLCGRCLAAEKPNILFLLSDDHSYPYLGCYGNQDVRTPNLDRLAAQGMRFDRMFVTCPQCVPSRASLMTGRSPVAVRMVRFTSPLPAEVPALPDLLRDKAGYFTGVGGRRYHLDGPPTKGPQGCVGHRRGPRPRWAAHLHQAGGLRREGWRDAGFRRQAGPISRRGSRRTSRGSSGWASAIRITSGIRKVRGRPRSCQAHAAGASAGSARRAQRSGPLHRGGGASRRRCAVRARYARETRFGRQYHRGLHGRQRHGLAARQRRAARSRHQRAAAGALARRGQARRRDAHAHLRRGLRADHAGTGRRHSAQGDERRQLR